LKKVLPERIKEVMGVLHLKLYIFDNNVIISGANLSNDYFTNRQDRYILIQDCKELADFFESLVDSISKFSFKATANDKITYENNVHPFLDKFDVYRRELGNDIKNVINSYYENYNLKTYKNDSNCAYVFPLVQLNYCNIKTDQAVTNKFFKLASENCEICFTTGYFNLTNEYVRSIIKENKGKFKVLVSSPESNGFFKAKGLSGVIPLIYSCYEEDFFKYSQLLYRDIKFFEYKRENWSYHAKGIWYYPFQNNQLPTMTLVGSSNYGFRSVYRDVEAQILIYTKNKELQTKINYEKINLFHNTSLVNSDSFACRKKFSNFMKFFVRRLKHFF
jgi:CDP-diacylglycerol--glycerol-3-phosphate 3-phosphatidyltransferase